MLFTYSYGNNGPESLILNTSAIKAVVTLRSESRPIAFLARLYRSASLSKLLNISENPRSSSCSSAGLELSGIILAISDVVGLVRITTSMAKRVQRFSLRGNGILLILGLSSC